MCELRLCERTDARRKNDPQVDDDRRIHAGVLGDPRGQKAGEVRSDQRSCSHFCQPLPQFFRDELGLVISNPFVLQGGGRIGRHRPATLQFRARATAEDSARSTLCSICRQLFWPCSFAVIVSK